jgi:outer membrane translocation and assembly module TamA
VKNSAAYNVFEPGMAAYYHGMSLLRAVTACALIAACGSSAPTRVRKPGDEYLQAIRFEGVEHVNQQNLLASLGLKRNLDRQGTIDEYQLSLDVNRIRGLYERRGFFEAKVTPRVERHGSAQTLVFRVVEGPRATATVMIRGLPPEVPYADARALIPVANNADYDYDLFDEAKTPLLAMVENAGYAHARLDAQALVDRAKHRVTLQYDIDPGPKVVFGKVSISGVNVELADAARNRLPFNEGDPYSTKAVAQAEQAILGTGRFAGVRLDVDPTSESTVLPVKLALTEQKRWALGLGGGAAFDPLNYQARLRGYLKHAGWPTPLTTLGVEFRPALTVLRDNCAFLDVLRCPREPRIRLIGTATQQDFLRRDTVGSLEGGLDYLQIEAYTMQGARAKVGIEAPFRSRRVVAQLGWQFAYYAFDQFTLVAPDPMDPMKLVGDPTLIDVTGTGKPERLGAFSEVLSIDLRDSADSPHLGGYAELRITHGGRYAGGAFDYFQLMPDLRGYLPLGSAVLAAHARLGLIFGDVPPTERFYSGGASTQRGFPERHLSPFVTGRDSDGNVTSVPVGGAGLLETGLELRVPFKLFDIPMGAGVFLDGGDVTLEPADLDVTNLHWATGVSLRPYYFRGLGPLRLDVAYRLNRTGMGEPLAGSHWSFIFGLGEPF